MYFLTLRNARVISTYSGAMAFAMVFLCVAICCQVYKVFIRSSRSLDGISRYLSVNFLIFVTSKSQHSLLRQE